MMAGPNVTPDDIDQGDPNAVELGVKFKADVDGAISGVRFYKATGNTGTHIGNLWTANGTLLARGTFSGETASGWQQLTFTTPVDITAGTTYVASYYAPRGHYSASSAYFFDPSPFGGNHARLARHCTRSARTTAAPTACTPTLGPRHSRRPPSTARTTPSTSCSRRSCRPAQWAT